MIKRSLKPELPIVVGEGMHPQSFSPEKDMELRKIKTQLKNYALKSSWIRVKCQYIQM